jgi:HEAT repeat protein
MLRTSRTIAALLTELVFGTVTVGTMLTASTILVGCEDESQPEYWVKKLDDPGKRPAAVKRLTQFYEDGMTKANNNRESPEMKALLGKIVGPMSQAYVKGDLDEKTRMELLKALSGTRDPGAKDAIIKAMQDFAAGKGTHEEMTQAATYVKVLKLKEASAALLEAFTKIKVSDPKLGPPYIAVQDAMREIIDPAWKPKLLDLLNRPIDPEVAKAGGKAEPAKLAEAKNEVYWQTVSAEMLGELKAADAVKPLFKTVVDPAKATIGGTAVVAMIKIGRPAVVPVLDILTGKDAEMLEFAKKVAGEKGKTTSQASAAIVLGTIGRAEALTPMVAALAAADNDALRGVIGREMSKLPTSPDAIKALQTAYEKIAPGALLPDGQQARVAIAEAAGSFMDASIVPWLLKMVESAGKEKMEKEDAEAMQSSLLLTAMKLMKKDQIEEVKKAVDKGVHELEKAAFKRGPDLLNACGDNQGCYLAKLEDPGVQEKNEQFTGIKAAYMLGQLGNDATKAEIVKRLPKIKNAAIRFVATSAIDHLSPNGDAKIADELQKIVDTDAARGDQTAIQANAPIKQIIPRLRARAS